MDYAAEAVGRWMNLDMTDKQLDDALRRMYVESGNKAAYVRSKEWALRRWKDLTGNLYPLTKS